MQELSSHSREIVEAGVAAGLYATPVPLQIFAYRSAQLEQVNMARTHLGAGTLLGGRILELLRIRSAQLGECEPCSQSRKHDSITDEDVACLLAPGHGALTPQENIARRLWFTRDHLVMAKALGWGEVAPFYIDLESPVPKSSIPKPGPLEVHLKDDHLQYAITWFALAGAVLIAFAVWWRAQRQI